MAYRPNRWGYKNKVLMRRKLTPNPELVGSNGAVSATTSFMVPTQGTYKLCYLSKGDLESTSVEQTGVTLNVVPPSAAITAVSPSTVWATVETAITFLSSAVGEGDVVSLSSGCSGDGCNACSVANVLTSVVVSVSEISAEGATLKLSVPSAGAFNVCHKAAGSVGDMGVTQTGLTLTVQDIASPVVSGFDPSTIVAGTGTSIVFNGALLTAGDQVSWAHTGAHFVSYI